MSKYMLFAGDDYYSLGGFDDFQMSGSIDECKATFADAQSSFDWGQIVDCDDLIEVEYFWSANEEWRKS